MNTFNKKSLFVALASLGALSVTGTADAVYVNPDGTGQVLLYPYYTVRNKVAGVGAPFNSLLSVVNSTASAKIVKVRFLEGKNSREVLDFNLYLSANDVWTTAVVPVGDGAGIITQDTSCTVPSVGRTLATASTFVNFAFAGSNADPAGSSLDRTTEGYVEIIEMGSLDDGSTTAGYITHVAGVPKDCSAITDIQSRRDLENPEGGLFGGITLVNVLAGEDITADAVALEDFREEGVFDAPGDIKPDLRDADPTWTVFASGGAQSGTTLSGIDAVSAVLMHRNVLNEFVLDTPTLSQTNWVVTFPTKRYYYDPAMTKCGASQVDCNRVLKLDVAPTKQLFQRNFVAGGACDDVGVTAWNREEQKPSTPGGFSPPPPTGAVPALCWEANVITFNSKNVFGSANVSNVNTAYENGWMNLNLVGGRTLEHTLPTSNGTFSGLPVIGFAAQTFNNGTLNDPAGRLIQSQYGGNFVHKYTPGR